MCKKITKFKLLILISFLFVISLGIFIYYKYANKVSDHHKDIQIYSEMLKEDPNNCFYNQQIAASYQALYKIDEAIKYYEIVIKNCPNDLLSIFQLGICYYLKMDKTLGLKYMNKAIEEAKKASDKELELMFKEEKSSWMEKWDLVKELDWNKQRDKKTAD